MSVNDAINDLVTMIDPVLFQAKFGSAAGQLNELVAAKTVTVSKLMELIPAGTIDPTPSLYNATMHAMAGSIVIAFFANLTIRPIDKKHHIENTHP
jgi:hypothetical protein